MPMIQAQVGIGNVFSEGTWWENLVGGKREFTFGICERSPVFKSISSTSQRFMLGYQEISWILILAQNLATVKF